MKKFIKIFKNQKGLTLIELLAVIVILAIVAAIAVPSIGNVINNSRDKAILADASSILSGAKLAETAGECTIATADATPIKNGDTVCSKTVLDSYVDNVGKLKAGTAADYSAFKSGKTWSVNLNKFADLRAGGKYKTEVGTDNSIDETTLNELLNN